MPGNSGHVHRGDSPVGQDTTDQDIVGSGHLYRLAGLRSFPFRDLGSNLGENLLKLSDAEAEHIDSMGSGYG